MLSAVTILGKHLERFWRRSVRPVKHSLMMRQSGKVKLHAASKYTEHFLETAVH